MTTSADADLWRYTCTLCAGLVESHDCDVVLVAFGQRPSPAQLAVLPPAVSSGRERVELHQLDLPADEDKMSPPILAEARNRLRALMLERHASVLHANHYFAGQVGLTGLPVLVVAHGDVCSKVATIGGEAQPIVDAGYVESVRAGLNAAAGIAAPNLYVADSLKRWFGYDGVVRIIPYGIDAPPREVGLVKRTIDACTTGDLWDRAVNFVCVQAAAAEMPGLAFAAAGPLTPPGIERTRPIPDSMMFTGAISWSEQRVLLAQSRLFVSAAIYDPLPLTSIEAARAGCCLVLSDTSFYRAMWGTAATYFDPADSTALRNRILDLLADEPRQRKMAQDAYERAVGDFGADRMVAAYAAVYKRLSLRYGIET